MDTNSRRFFEANDEHQPKEQGPILVAVDLRTPGNLGSLIRVADNFNCTKVIFVSDETDFRNRAIRKTARTSFDAVNWEFCTRKELADLLPDDYSKIAIETSPNAKSVYEISLPKKVVFFLGNEKVGLDGDTVRLADQSVYIPMPGANKSMNVSHAGAVIVAEWLRQHFYSS